MTTLRMIPGITYTRKNLEALTGMPDRENRRMIREQRRQGVPIVAMKDGGYKRNEPLDIRNYATVALEIANPILKPPEHDTTAPTPRRRGRRSRTNGGIL